MQMPTKSTRIDESFHMIKASDCNQQRQELISIDTSEDLTLEDDKSFTFTPTSSSSGSYSKIKQPAKTPETDNLGEKLKLNKETQGNMNKSIKRVSSSKLRLNESPSTPTKSSDDSNIKYVKQLNTESAANIPQDFPAAGQHKLCYKNSESPADGLISSPTKASSKTSPEKQLRPSISCESFQSNDKEKEELKVYFPGVDVDISDICHKSIAMSNSSLSLFTVVESRKESSSARKRRIAANNNEKAPEIPNQKIRPEFNNLKLDFLKSSVNFKENLLHHQTRSHEFLIDNLNIVIRLLSFGDINNFSQKGIVKSIANCFFKKSNRKMEFLALEDNCCQHISEILEEFELKCKAVSECFEEETHIDEVKIDVDPYSCSFREDIIDFVFGIKSFDEKQALMNILIDQNNL